MRFLEKNKVLVIVSVVVLLGLVVAVGVHFFHKEEEIPDISKDPVVLPEEDEWEIVNTSSKTIDELWTIVEEKRDSLRKVFYDSNIYQVSEIDSEQYTAEDDSKYVAFDSSFLETLNGLVSDDLYYSFFNRMQLIKDRFYVTLQDNFASIYFQSAIAEQRVESSEIRLMSATDEFINASVTLYICEDEEGVECNHILQVPFELVYENDQWKVNVFQK